MASYDALFDPYDLPNEGAVIVESWTELQYDSGSEAVRPYGRGDPVVVTSTRAWPTGTLVLVTETETQFEWLRDLLATGRIIGFRPYDEATGLGEELYLHVGKASSVRIVRRASAPERRWTLEVSLVKAPVLT